MTIRGGVRHRPHRFPKMRNLIHKIMRFAGLISLAVVAHAGSIGTPGPTVSTTTAVGVPSPGGSVVFNRCLNAAGTAFESCGSSGASGSASGDLSGTYPSPTVVNTQAGAVNFSTITTRIDDLYTVKRSTGVNIPASEIAAGTLGATVIASSVAVTSVGPKNTCGSASVSCSFDVDVDGRITRVSSAAIAAGESNTYTSSKTFTSSSGVRFPRVSAVATPAIALTTGTIASGFFTNADDGSTFDAIAAGSQQMRFDSTGVTMINGNGRYKAGLGVRLDGAGTVTTPDYSYSGDTNTGMYSKGADLLGLVTGGVERLTINATGQITIGGVSTVTVKGNAFSVGASTFVVSGGLVGIGTASPCSTCTLHVVGTGNFTGALRQGSVVSCATGVQTDADGLFSACVASDRSLKRRIAPAIIAPDSFAKLRPVTYFWKDPVTRDSKKHLGFIAQEVEALYPNAVVPAGKGLKGLDESALVAILVKKVQELESRVKALEPNK